MESRQSGWGSNMKSQISDSADNEAGDLLVIYSCLFFALPLFLLFFFVHIQITKTLQNKLLHVQTTCSA